MVSEFIEVPLIKNLHPAITEYIKLSIGESSYILNSQYRFIVPIIEYMNCVTISHKDTLMDKEKIPNIVNQLINNIIIKIRKDIDKLIEQTQGWYIDIIFVQRTDMEISLFKNYLQRLYELYSRIECGVLILPW